MRRPRTEDVLIGSWPYYKRVRLRIVQRTIPLLGKRKERRGVLRRLQILCNRMDSTSVILRLIIVYATFRNWHLAKCEVFSESEQSSIDETIEELMKCRQIPGRSVQAWRINREAFVGDDAEEKYKYLVFTLTL